MLKRWKKKLGVGGGGGVEKFTRFAQNLCLKYIFPKFYKFEVPNIASASMCVLLPGLTKKIEKCESIFVSCFCPKKM